jgi:hypothetical protein
MSLRDGENLLTPFRGFGAGRPEADVFRRRMNRPLKASLMMLWAPKPTPFHNSSSIKHELENRKSRIEKDAPSLNLSPRGEKTS